MALSASAAVAIAARRADRICFAVGADTERLAECIESARKAAEEAGRDPDSLRYGAYVNCVVNPDPEVAREAIRGGLSVFAHFSGFQGMDIDSLPEGTRAAARHLRTGYDMKNHGVASGDHAQALEADFIHRFGIAGPAEEAARRLKEIRDVGIDFLRVVPGSRDMPPGVGATSLQGLASVVDEVSAPAR